MSLPEGDELPVESGVEQPARSRMPMIKIKDKSFFMMHFLL
jgi:hypothetical protein